MAAAEKVAQTCAAWDFQDEDESVWWDQWSWINTIHDVQNLQSLFLLKVKHVWNWKLVRRNNRSFLCPLFCWVYNRNPLLIFMSVQFDQMIMMIIILHCVFLFISIDMCKYFHFSLQSAASLWPSPNQLHQDLVRLLFPIIANHHYCFTFSYKQRT